jgi:hypothetical protein
MGLRLLARHRLVKEQKPILLEVTPPHYGISCLGASDGPTVEWLAEMPNVRVRVFYDTEQTRLHARAYYFQKWCRFNSYR